MVKVIKGNKKNDCIRTELFILIELSRHIICKFAQTHVMSLLKFEQLLENIEKFQYTVDTELQIACCKRIKSGGDALILSEDKKQVVVALIAGILEIVQTPADDDAPRILIVAPDKDTCLEIELIWTQLSKRTEMIHTLTLETGDKIKQRNALFNGADLVIGMPKRVNELYFQNGINVNHLNYFVIIDSEKCIKNSSINHLARMVDSFPKCQKIISNDVLAKYTERLVDAILVNPLVITE